MSDQPAPLPDSTGQAEYKGFGFTFRLPLPKWAVSLLAAAVVLFVILFGAFWTVTKVQGDVAVPRPEYNEYSESYKHSTDAPDKVDVVNQEFPADATSVRINHYQSDGCVQVVRTYKSAGLNPQATWMFGPSVAAQFKKAQSNPVAALLLPVASKAAMFEGRCENPHPGKWTEARKQINRCTVQVWRTFSDSCTHYQIFNACMNTWDVNANGAPKVIWTRCVH